ncbi:DNA mismatch repair protein MutS2 [Alkalispirochaeta americana]|uniref:Endonuclease MutS2 n=1 Tax=Alkalispirochaeta americana TaxID=159291 RepID=A0A1N6P2B3_9SPIO|nr:Smr/MutS family protein [Alkalispirochaeta americana]SIP98407.1 DNA mismatch repair protein MutS2 [Alkalispirochaeta americana]
MTALTALEFDRIRPALAALTATEEGRLAMASLEPEDDLLSLDRLADDVRSILQALEAGVPAPGGDVPPLEEIFTLLSRRGTVLELEQLVALRHLLETAQDFRRFFRAGEEEGYLPEGRSARLQGGRALHGTLRSLLTGEGEIKEEAVPEIVALRRQITGLHQDLHRSSEAILRSSRDIYREDRATLRDGRTVLPLISDFRGRVEGIIHESSGSGETLFVEPPELVDLNNRLVRTQNDIIREVRRVLREISEEARSCREELYELYGQVVAADCLLARARYGMALSGRIVSRGEQLHLIQARHPLLGKACVPLDITFDSSTRLMVLSGPNTGGKTVFLKTLGLLVLMSHCGVPIPVAEGSSLPFFRWIGVDIGDEQSLDESLSTFSAHLRTLGEIARQADEQSLILLDELGSGTDPEEGAALSMAIVDHLMERGSTILATTHQTILKHYGYTRQGAVNAAMAFDEESHRPTYRVIPGRPGGSHAIDAAREQGLLPEIVEKAAAYHSAHHNSVTEIIQRLTREEERLNQERQNVARLQEELVQERDQAARTREYYQEQERLLKKEGLREISRALDEARRRVEAEIRSVREAGGKLEKDQIRRAQGALEELADLKKATAAEAEEAVSGEDSSGLRGIGASLETAEAGASVRHRKTGRSGVILRVRKGRAEVQFGAIRMTVPLEELEEEACKAGRAPSRPVVSAGSSRPAPPAALELDLRGYRLAAALEELERSVDASVMHGVPVLSIIHGTGTGVLQKGVHEYLEERREVHRYRFALPEDGGFGKTVVEFLNDSRVG